MVGFAACFEEIKDPRTGNAGRHDLLEILMIALCSVLCGGQTAVDMAEFGKAKEGFLRRFLKLERGIPSPDTFSRVFRLLDPEQFRACFITFMARFAEAAQGVIAIDGKTLRHSFDTASATSCLHMVSAWGCEQRLVLGQRATDAKSNEITAVPKLLDLLVLNGTIVTVDAMNCQRDIARRIIDKGGEYVFALKANQQTLYDDVRRFLDDPDTAGVERHTTVEGDHGRIETRTALVSTDIAWLQDIHHWPGLDAIGKVIRTREVNGKITTETAFYLASSPLSAERFSTVTRAHWGIECPRGTRSVNSLHWVLDVAMNEDNARNRKDNGPENLAILRHMALNIIRKEKSKGSTRLKFKHAAWNDDFLAKLLAQI